MGSVCSELKLGSSYNCLPVPASTSIYTALSPPPLLHQPSTRKNHTFNPSVTFESSKRKSLAASLPNAKRASIESSQELPEELGEYIDRDVKLLQQLGWNTLVSSRRGEGDFTSLSNVQHEARRLLRQYKYRGVPVKFSTPAWSRRKLRRSIRRGPHKSCREYTQFLNDEFIEMVARGQWIVLPYSAVKDLPGLRASPPGVVPQVGRRPRWIVDYSFWGINEETLPLVALESMQFGRALDRILREILLANPALGPVHLIKVDLSDGFYRVDLNPDDIPKLGVVFPTEKGEEPLMAFPLVLPMGWSNSPPAFSTVTETIADLANTRIATQETPPSHHLDELAETIPSPSPLHALDSASCMLPSVEGALNSASCNLPSVEGSNLALDGLSCNLPAIEGPSSRLCSVSDSPPPVNPSSLLCSVSDSPPPVNSPSPVVKQIASLLRNRLDECKVRPTAACVTSCSGDSVGNHLRRLIARDPSLPE